MNKRRFAAGAGLLALLSAGAMIVEPTVASAQTGPYGDDQNAAPPPASQYQAPAPYQQPAPPAQYQAPPQGQYQQPAPPPPAQYQAPPQGQYQQPAPPPAQYQAPPQGQDYNNWAYQQDYQNYRAQYAQWAAQNCVTQHTNNIAAGAIIGGVAGALLAGSIAGWAARGAWVLFGGSLGLATGAAIGASSSAPGCPTGYAVRTSAPPFYYSGPAYAYQPAYPAYAPRPYYYRPAYYGYRPAYNGGWVWDGYRWVRRPRPYYGY